MDYAAFDAIMREGIIVRWIVPAALIAATLVGVVWYFISKHRNGIASDRSLGFMLVMAAALVLSVIISIDRTKNMIYDLQNQSYAVVHGEYERKFTRVGRDMEYVTGITTDDEKHIWLRQPIRLASAAKPATAISPKASTQQRCGMELNHTALSHLSPTSRYPKNKKKKAPVPIGAGASYVENYFIDMASMGQCLSQTPQP